MKNPLERRPNVACIIIPPKTPDEIKNLMVQVAVELSGLNWWVRTGANPDEIEIAKAAGKKGAVCSFREETPKVSPAKHIELVDEKKAELIETYSQLFKQVADTRMGGYEKFDVKHLPRAIEQLAALLGSKVSYPTCARLAITWWEEKKRYHQPYEKWPLITETISYCQTSPDFPASANIVNLARTNWKQSFAVSIPELREKMPHFTLAEIGQIDMMDATAVPF